MLPEGLVETGGSPTARTAGAPAATPVFFGAPDRPLFGWFEAPGDGMVGAGVVICPPLAVEGTCSQPTLRFLSAGLAAEGCAVLRLDYAGTGDSSGDDREPARVAAWLASIRTAVDFMKEAGCAQIRGRGAASRGDPGRS